MDMQSALSRVTERRDLSDAEMRGVMAIIMGGQATPAQIGGFLVGLRMKGETVEEITAAATVMRSLATLVPTSGDHLIDTCGTGGDGNHTLNISTAAAFVVAAAGGRVAKHGNRSVSSSSGSADVLEVAGVNLGLSAEQVAACIEQVGIGFMFAPHHHGAMRHAVGPRREMGIRTLFNLLGPLTNPAQASNQLLGVFADKWLVPIAKVLQRLGSQHVMVVHAEDGLDEISIGANTHVAELRDREVVEYILSPERFGIARTNLAAIRVGSAQESFALIKQALTNVAGPALDVVLLNAGAAIYVANLVASLEEGVERARQVIASGAAWERLNALVRVSRSF